MLQKNGFEILPGEIKRIKGEVEDFNDFESTKKYFLNSNVNHLSQEIN